MRSKRLNGTKYLLLAILGLACVCLLPVVGFAQEIPQLTRPSAIYQLSFVRPGLIREQPVKEGDLVKEGQMICRQDDRAEQVQLADLKLQAESTVKIDYAKRAWDKSAVTLTRAEKAYKVGAITDEEFDEAKLDTQVKEASWEVAKLEHEDVKANYEAMKFRVDQMEIKSPCDGVVEQLILKKGEGSDALAKVLIVLQIDPLWVDVPVPLARVGKLKVGQTAMVQLFGPDEDGNLRPSGQFVEGKITFIASMAQANQLTARVEVPNPQHRPAGEPVHVTFAALPDVKPNGVAPGTSATKPATRPAGVDNRGILSRSSSWDAQPLAGATSDGGSELASEDGAALPPHWAGERIAWLEEKLSPARAGR
jgi:RND family efflux transporter MFP subunit